MVSEYGQPGRRAADIPKGMTTYSAVVTTGIYCRPGCRARPRAENVRTFELAASAEAAGFRACLRCRLAVQALATLGVQVWDGLHRADLAGFLAVLAWSTGAQVAVAAGVKALDGAAGQAAAAAGSEHAALERAATAATIRAARHARWLALQESAVPLVAELAAGTADPGDEHVRIRCAIQAARLRRLLAEGDEVPGSLVHELHASADVAERRGVAVDIETAGPLPQVPGPVRRVITDAAITILTAAHSQVRITLAAVAAGIAVSFVADTSAVVRLPAAEGVVIEQQQDGGMLWAEARWNSQ